MSSYSRLFELAPGGEFVQLSFPQGNGEVREDRYETSLSMSRSLSRTLSLQLIGAMEFSTIEQTGLIQAGSRVEYKVFFQFEDGRDVDEVASSLDARLDSLGADADTIATLA